MAAVHPRAQTCRLVSRGPRWPVSPAPSGDTGHKRGRMVEQEGCCHSASPSPGAAHAPPRTSRGWDTGAKGQELPWGAVPPTGVAPGAGSPGRGGGRAVCPSGGGVGILGSRWQCATTRSYAGAGASTRPVAGAPARSISPGISVPRDVGTPAHPLSPGCPHGSFLRLATGPGAAPSCPEPQGTFPVGAQGAVPPRPAPGEAPRPRAARCPGCPAVQMAPPPRRVAASTLTCGCFLCPFSLRVGLSSSLPPLGRPRPPVQPPPEPATHTSELFCVFQQLKRIKQQLSPGRAWILVTLIFCVAGQGEWGY